MATSRKKTASKASSVAKEADDLQEREIEVEAVKLRKARKTILSSMLVASALLPAVYFNFIDATYAMVLLMIMYFGVHMVQRQY